MTQNDIPDDWKDQGLVPGMAYIGKVMDVIPIKNADRIESIEVVCGSGGKWRAIAQVGEFRIGDRCEIYLQDSILPEDDARFDFMEKYKYRVRMIRLRGTPSEALVLPLGPDMVGEVGNDITEYRRVRKYVKQISPQLQGIAAGAFPLFVPKTDEVNFQRVPKLVAAMLAQDWFYVTEKYDGISCTIYRRDHHLGACSRNIEYLKGDTEIGVYWRMAIKYKILETLTDLGKNYAIQMEIVGPGIQKNPLKLDTHEIRVFDIYDIDRRTYLDGAEVYGFCTDYGLPMVRVLHTLDNHKMDDEDWRKLAEGEYDSGVQREGIVVRPIYEQSVEGQRLSFKVINLLYKGD